MSRPPENLTPMAQAMEWATRIMAVALEMVIPGLVGKWLDDRLGTWYCVLLGFGFGLFAGMWHLVLMTRQLSRPKPSRQQQNGQSRE